MKVFFTTSIDITARILMFLCVLIVSTLFIVGEALTIGPADFNGQPNTVADNATAIITLLVCLIHISAALFLFKRNIAKPFFVILISTILFLVIQTIYRGIGSIQMFPLELIYAALLTGLYSLHRLASPSSRLCKRPQVSSS